MPPAPERLFGITWVHVFEEDTGAGAVFRPETADIPLSRRPRERLRLYEDGTAAVLTGGPDDRPRSRPARWTREGDTLVVTGADGGVRLRVVGGSADRLIVQFSSQDA